MGPSLGPTDGEKLGTEEGIILSSSDGEVIGTTLWAADGITLGLDEGTELVSSDGSSDGYNELVLGSDEAIILVSTDGEVIGSTLGATDRIKTSFRLQ